MLLEYVVYQNNKEGDKNDDKWRFQKYTYATSLQSHQDQASLRRTVPITWNWQDILMTWTYLKKGLEMNQWYHMKNNRKIDLIMPFLFLTKIVFLKERSYEYSSRFQKNDSIFFLQMV